MKRILILFAFAALVTAGCKKEDEKPSYPGSFTINSKTYNVTGMYWVDLGIGTSFESYSITGSNTKDQTKMYINLSAKTTGDKAIGSDNDIELEIGNDQYISSSGKIVVTKFDDTASGTFDCQFIKNEEASESIHITGKFEAQKATFDL